MKRNKSWIIRIEMELGISVYFYNSEIASVEEMAIN
jgi:hypothetical protein